MSMQSLTIPHQQVRLGSGDSGTFRASLAVSPEGTATGHVALSTRDRAHRYRAISGTIRRDDRQGLLEAAVQLEGLAALDGIGELAELTVWREGASGTDIIATLRSLPDDELIARCRVRIEPRD